MLTKGDKKLTLFQGDRKPYSLFKGGKQIAGATLKDLTGDISFSSPYKAPFPSIEVDGMAFQGFKQGKNLFDKDSLLMREGVLEITDNGFVIINSYGTGIMGGEPFNKFINAVRGKTITVSRKRKTAPVEGLATNRIVLLPKGDSQRIILVNENADTNTLTMPSDLNADNYIGMFAYGVSDANVYYENVKIEIGTSATPYEPYWTIGDKPVLKGYNLCSYGTKTFENTFSQNNDLTLDAGTYWFSAVIESTDTDANFCRVAFYDEFLGNEIDYFTFYRSESGERVKRQITLPKPAKGIYLYASSSYSTGQGDTATFKDIQISKEDKPYEPYIGGTPAPNPYYPIEPVFNKGNGLKVEGKNLWDFYLKEGTIDYRYNGFESDYDTVIVKPWMIGKTITYSLYADASACGNSAGMGVWVKGADNTYLRVQYKNYISVDAHKKGYSYATFTITSEMKKIYLGLSMYGDYGAVSFKDRMVEFGEERTSFEPYYPPQEIEVPVLRAIPDTEYKDTYNPQTGVITRRIKEIVCTGNEDWVDNWYPTVLIDLWDYGYGEYGCKEFSNYATNGRMGLGNGGGTTIGFTDIRDFGCKTLEEFKTFLKQRYAEGKPVKMWYVLKTPIEEKVTTTPLIQDWSGTIKQSGGDCGKAPLSATVYEEFKE